MWDIINSHSPELQGIAQKCGKGLTLTEIHCFVEKCFYPEAKSDYVSVATAELS